MSEQSVAAVAEAAQVELGSVEATAPPEMGAELEEIDAVGAVANEPADVAAEFEVLADAEADIELGGAIEAVDGSLTPTEPVEMLDFGSAAEPELVAPELSVNDDVDPGVGDVSVSMEPSQSLEALVEASWEPPVAEVGLVVIQAGDATPASELGEPPVASFEVAADWAPLPDEDHEPTSDEESEPALSELGAPLDLSPFDHETGERLSVVIESAPEALEALVVETDTQATALEVLEQVARRVRSGELRVAPAGASAESVLASILAALLSPRS